MKYTEFRREFLEILEDELDAYDLGLAIDYPEEKGDMFRIYGTDARHQGYVREYSLIDAYNSYQANADGYEHSLDNYAAAFSYMIIDHADDDDCVCPVCFAREHAEEYAVFRKLLLNYLYKNGPEGYMPGWIEYPEDAHEEAAICFSSNHPSCVDGEILASVSIPITRTFQSFCIGETSISEIGHVVSERLLECIDCIQRKAEEADCEHHLH